MKRNETLRELRVIPKLTKNEILVNTALKMQELTEEIFGRVSKITFFDNFGVYKVIKASKSLYG